MSIGTFARCNYQVGVGEGVGDGLHPTPPLTWLRRLGSRGTGKDGAVGTTGLFDCACGTTWVYWFDI